MRGYGVSRFLWPVHFALLHNDCLWVLDEAPLMGAGLTTAIRLEALRRDLATGVPTRSLRLSATPASDRPAPAAADSRSGRETPRRLRLLPQEQTSAQMVARFTAVKRLHPAATRLTRENAKAGADCYAAELADEVLEKHAAVTQTLVVVNTVEWAQALYQTLVKRRLQADLLLVHARFQQTERDALTEHLGFAPYRNDHGRIVVTTQAIEAGVDLSSHTLFTELAPWSALVQRFGRCNRHGELNAYGTDIFWIDLEENLTAPYPNQSLGTARQILGNPKPRKPRRPAAASHRAPRQPRSCSRAISGGYSTRTRIALVPTRTSLPTSVTETIRMCRSSGAISPPRERPTSRTPPWPSSTAPPWGNSKAT